MTNVNPHRPDPAAQPTRYVPAAGRFGLTRLYDPAMAATMRESVWRPRLIARVSASTPAGGLIVDVGAGTGTLAIALAAARPDAQVIAVDGDPQTLAIAAGKLGADRVRWIQGFAGVLDLADAGADAIVMSLLLHHLVPDDKRRALRDARRALRADGRLHIADWGAPGDPLMRAAFGVLQLLDGRDGTRDHAAGRLAQIIKDCGFQTPQRYLRLRTMWGRLELLEATVVEAGAST
jgi:ubiquinone/menaquinone biosynthesis C-methylase UbiE